jgi:antitoxin component of RelBE/YafQ-DinJ toxin-antitoxin module
MIEVKKPKNVSVHIRADEDLAKEFKRVVEQQGYTQSLVMRELMKEYLAKNKQLDLLK